MLSEWDKDRAWWSDGPSECPRSTLQTLRMLVTSLQKELCRCDAAEDPEMSRFCWICGKAQPGPIGLVSGELFPAELRDRVVTMRDRHRETQCG